MAQHDYNLANQSGADFRADLNNALSAIATTNSGATSPSTTFAHQLWVDTANSVLKIRNSANDAWITTGVSITADNTFDINGGTVNGITSFSFSTGSTVTSILDEDNLASDSATALATQQSIKAYVDSQVGTVDTLAEILLNGNTTGGTDIAVSTGDDITFADSSKAIFGTGSDLEIFHDGSNSFIKDAGTGDLVVRSSTNIFLQDATGANNYAKFTTNAVELRHNNDVRFVTTGTGINVTGEVESDTAHFGTGTGTGTIIADEVVVSGTGSTGITIHSPDANNATLVFGSTTDNDYAYIQGYYNSGSPFIRTSILGSEVTKVTSTGIDVTGTVVSDGLTVQTTQGDIAIANSASSLNFTRAGTNYIRATNAAGHFKFITGANDFATQRLDIASNGDISFYDDTGSTQGLFWDASTERLGIGTTSPSTSARLTLDGSGAFDHGLSIQRTGVDDPANFRLDGASGLLIEQTGAKNIKFETNNAERVRITSDGSVGIGTTAPSGLLEISADSDDGTSAPSFLITNASTTLNDGAVVGTIEFRNSDASGTPPHTAKIQGIANASDERTTELAFSTGSVGTTTERLRIASNGSVGIGTVSPSSNSKLHINDSSTSDSQYTLHLESYAPTIVFEDVSGGTQDFSIQANTNALTFSVGDATTGTKLANEKLRLTSAGNLGIGTSSPSAALHVNGGIKLSDNNYLTWANSNTRMVGQSGYLQFQIAGSDSMRLTPTGLGIGTTSPTQKLEVDGAVLIKDSNTEGTLYLTNTSVGVKRSNAVDTANSRDIEIFTDGGGANVVFSTNGAGSAEMVVSDSGNVGIGTDSPTGKLTVSNAGESKIDIEDTGGQKHRFFVRNSDKMFGIYDVNNASTWFRYAGDATASNRKVALLENGGNVGIGTSSPSNTLEVNGNIAVNTSSGNNGIKIITGNTAEGFLIFGDAQDNSMGGISYNNSTNSLSIDCNNSEAIRIDSSQRVGIGTTSPASPLHLKVAGTGGSNILSLENDSNKYDFRLSGSDLLIRDGSLDRIALDSSGNVGIGTSSPSEKLTIKKTVTTGDGATALLGVFAEGGAAGEDAEIYLGHSSSRAAKIVAHKKSSGNNHDLSFSTNADASAPTEKMRITSGGNVGIGTDSPFDLLDVAGSGNVGLRIRTSGGGTPQLKFHSAVGVESINSGVGSVRNMTFEVGGSERMRIDSSGNLLVGKTSADNTTQGIRLLGSAGFASFVRDSSEPIIVNRLTDYGDLIKFRNDGSEVGSIGTRFTDLYIGTDDTRLRFNDADDRINAADATGGARDAAVDLGGSSARFKDLYLSGQANVGTINNVGIKANETNFTGSILISDDGATGTLSSATSNTGLGSLVLANLTSGASNVAVGRQALNSLTTGSNNTAVGRNALFSNTTASNNVAIGYYALSDNTTGQFNTAIGREALTNNTTANNNTAVGYKAAQNVTTGSQITAIGYGAGDAYTDASSATAVGWNCLGNATVRGTGLGAYCLSALTTGASNSAFGYYAMNSTSTGASNAAFGDAAMQQNTTGSSNVAVGRQSVQNNTTGSNNIGLGFQALKNNTIGNSNVGVGYQALLNTTGYDNTGLGKLAGELITTGDNNTCIGNDSNPASATTDNSITLGDANITSLRCNTQTISALSDARDKTNIEDLQLGVEFIKDLRPVSFTWDRRDGSQNGVEDFGFIAQELDAVQEKHNEAERLGLVLKDNPDKLEASYGKLVPMLVKAIQELSEEVESLKQKLGE